MASDTLTREQRARRVAQLLPLAQAGDRQARNEIVELNMGLCFLFSSEYAGRGLDREDLVQAGSLGLMRAIETVDLSKGSFSTYAGWWIRQSMRQAVQKQSRTIYVPTGIQELESRIYTATRNLEKEFGFEPPVESIALATDLSVERVKEIQDLYNKSTRVSSLNSDDVVGNEVIESVIDETVDLVKETTDNDIKQKLEGALEDLSQAERAVIIMRWGLYDTPIYDYELIAPKLGFAATRRGALNIRVIESEALDKLATHKELTGLYQALTEAYAA